MGLEVVKSLLGIPSCKKIHPRLNPPPPRQPPLPKNDLQDPMAALACSNRCIFCVMNVPMCMHVACSMYVLGR